ncbi:MAG: hypothetical protein QOG19_2710 [Mycobacterium sp.]|jgi:hypothetical protein|nr:hypothetical protein [Mycobacterium sp.]
MKIARSTIGQRQRRRAAGRAAARFAAVAAVVLLCGGCGSKTTEPQGSTTSGANAPMQSTTTTSTDCQVHSPGSSSIDGVFANLAGFTVTQICPADVVPRLGGPEVTASKAAEVSQNGNSVLRVAAAQLKSGSGDAFVHDFISGMASRIADPNKALASEPQVLGGHQVTHFNIPLSDEGYAYGAGSAVVIAYVQAGSNPAAARDAFTKILANLH